MVMQTTLSELTVNAQADVMAGLLDGGYIDVMTGPQPNGTDEQVTTQRVLVVMTFSKPAFTSAQGGVIAANPIGAGVGVADGEAKWFRAYRADHRTPVFDGSAGKGAGNNMSLPSKMITEGVTVGCSGLTHTVRKSMPGI